MPDVDGTVPSQWYLDMKIERDRLQAAAKALALEVSVRREEVEAAAGHLSYVERALRALVEETPE